MRLIVGLGNPGAAYAQTRHNAGMWVVERAAARWSARFVRHGTAQRASLRHGSQEIELAGTLDFMNVTGAPLKRLLREHQLTPDDIILVHDDLDLEPGRLRIKQAGGHGGHNGLKSVIDALGTSQFVRVKIGIGRLEGQAVTIAVQDFDFMGGSLGMAAGEAVITGLETAVRRQTPFIMFAASGGARMQEGILSLMQLPRTTVGVQMLRETRKPYIVVLTNPTTGGVTASYAMLGDVHIAEPGALIGFAGPRVIEQTIREKLPDGFQRAEYLAEHGMVDMVVHRHKLRSTLAELCRLLTRTPAPSGQQFREQLPVPAHA